MATSKVSVFLLLVLIYLASVLGIANGHGLKVGFYHKTCPSLESVVKKTVDQVVAASPSLAAPLLRMHFHDCFVRGCEGSVLLNSSKNNQAEKDALQNLSVRGFEIIDKIKSAVEEACPALVSCADIIAIAARDATVAMKGPFWEVETGRRDGTVSSVAEAFANLPFPNDNITTLIKEFQRKGLTKKDLVVLSGSHTIGSSHCNAFANRLYNFSGKGDSDPSLDPSYISELKAKCKPGDQTTFVAMDPASFRKFDKGYYVSVSKRKGLFESDSALLNDPTTRTYLYNQVNNMKSSFFTDFGVSMVRMGKLGVLTGTAGEIRNVCSRVN